MLRLNELEAALSTYRRRVAAPQPESRLTKDDLTEALVAALSQFTDSSGNLRVRQNNGATPYGGGGA